MEDRVELRAVEFARAYYESKGYTAANVSRVRGDHGGYDLLATRGDEKLKIEVKGSTKPFGIPDPYHTEFDPKTRQLIADVLCVVYFVPGSEQPLLAIIPREAILPEYIIPKFGYRISGRFKNERTIRPFLVDLSPSGD